jgi:hypothetical protein
MVIDHGERELNTRSVGAIGFVWEERRTLMTIRSREHAQSLEPFGVAQKCGNRDTGNLEFVRTIHRKDVWRAINLSLTRDFKWSKGEFVIIQEM